MIKFLVKLVLNGLFLIPLLLWFTNASFSQIIAFTVVLGVVAFLVGDQIILPLSNNTVATVADAGLTGLMLWAADRTYNWGLTSGELFITVLVLGAVEFAYHRMLGHWDREETPKRV